MLSITGIFGIAAHFRQQAPEGMGIRMALGAQRKEVLQAALGRRLQIARVWFPRLDCCSESWRAAFWLSSCTRATPRDPWY